MTHDHTGTEASSAAAVRLKVMNSMQMKAQHPSRHTENGAAGRLLPDRRSHLRALPEPVDQVRTPAGNAADCEDGCHYCQGPETD